MKKRRRIVKVHLLKTSNSVWCFTAAEDVNRSTKDPREATCVRCLKAYDDSQATKHETP